MSSPQAGRLLVVSPHLDDAVFGVGQLLAAHRGSIVVTVFAGIPEEGREATAWDRRSGFGNGREAMQARRSEDRAALEPLSAHPLWLDFLDAQYAASPPVDAVAARLEAVLNESPVDAALIPLGLFHSDHELTHDACLRARERLRGTTRGLRWLAYEDALYRRRPGLLQRRLGALAARGIQATPWFTEVGSPALKAGAVQSYASQLRAFGEHGYDDVAAPERYWQLDDAAR